MITLRELTADDALEINSWPAYPGDMAQMDYALRSDGWLQEFGHDGSSIVYAAMDGAELVGFSVLARTGGTEAEFRIAVRADRTGQRLGEAIASLTLRRGFAELGLTRINLIVRPSNHRGMCLYRRLGFVDCGECRKEIQGVMTDFRIMTLNRGKSMSHRALIVIDVQNDYVGGNLPIEYPPVEVSLANIGRAMDAARGTAIPVVVVQNINPEGMPVMAKGTPGAELHASIVERGWDHYVQKDLPSAFAGTGLAEWLRTKGITTVTITGYMTHNCDLSTAVQGLHDGFTVELLSDATGSLPYANRAGSASAEEIHRVMTVVLNSRFATVMTTDEWLHAVAGGTLPERDGIFASNLRARGLRE